MLIVQSQEEINFSIRYYKKLSLAICITLQNSKNVTNIYNSCDLVMTIVISVRVCYITEFCGQFFLIKLLYINNTNYKKGNLVINRGDGT